MTNSIFISDGQFLTEGSFSRSLATVIREIWEASFQVLIYHPSVPRALHAIALVLIFMLDEVRVPHLSRYYPALGPTSTTVQAHPGGSHTIPYLTNTTGISSLNLDDIYQTCK